MWISGLTESPVQVSCFGNANSRAGHNFARFAGIDFYSLTNRRPIEAQVNSKSLAELAGTRTKLGELIRTTSFLHCFNTGKRLESANKDGTDMMFVGRDIDAMIGSIDVIDIDIAVGLKHDR